jgi:hypothetical protein
MNLRRICVIDTAPLMVQVFSPLCRYDALNTFAEACLKLGADHFSRAPELAMEYPRERLARLRPD